MKVVELSGGVGGARMARGLAGIPDVELTVVVNVGDDADNLGLRVSPDLDTVLYTLAGVEGPMGWGRAGDTFSTNEELSRFGIDNTFRIGDRDLALKLYRTAAMSSNRTLADTTLELCGLFELDSTVTPVTNDRLRTEVLVDRGGWISFQEYFVNRRSQDTVLELRYTGAEVAKPVPGLIDSITNADLVLIAPSNPPLSIWPILEVQGVRSVVAAHERVTAVSPLIEGKAIKGPADRVMADLGLPKGNVGVARAYEGLIDTLIIDSHDAADVESLAELNVVVTDTLIEERDAAIRLAHEIVNQ